MGPLAVAFVALVASVYWLVGIHSPNSSATLTRLTFVIETTTTAGATAALWLASALGWGRLWRKRSPSIEDSWSLQFGCGLATLLWLAHLLGWLGLLTNRSAAWFLVSFGICLLADQLRGSRLLDRRRVPWTALLGVPAAAVLLVASSSLPGWLWDSEAYGYDVLEYHLQLPAEWLAIGRITVLRHNVYSCLPSYVEAGTLHLGVLFGSMHAASGLLLRSAQFIQAGLAVAFAAMIGRLVARQSSRVVERDEATLAGGFSTAFVLLNPWTQVVGSMAYDEMTVNVLFAAAVSVLTDREGWDGWKGFLAGFLVGAAAGAKLLAAFLVGGPAMVLFTFSLPARRWPTAGLAMGVGMLLGLGPYLLRNWLDLGNPVFPFATELFGSAHWTADQVERWERGNHFPGSLIERALAIWTQGVGDENWIAFFAIATVAAFLAWRLRGARRQIVCWSTVVVSQIGGWLLLTMLPARFLVPLLLPGGIVVGLGFSAVASGRSERARAFTLAVACVALVPLFLRSIQNFAAQRGGDPVAYVSREAFAFRTGEMFVDEPDLGSVAPLSYHVNFALPPGSLVYLLGDARPLYFTKPVLYHTTWDRSPFGDLVRGHPEDPAAWARGLAELGVTHVLVSYAELDRLRKWGTYDPAVTSEAVQELLARFGRLEASVGSASALFRLLPLPPESGDSPSLQ